MLLPFASRSFFPIHPEFECCYCEKEHIPSLFLNSPIIPRRGDQLQQALHNQASLNFRRSSGTEITAHSCTTAIPLKSHLTPHQTHASGIHRHKTKHLLVQRIASHRISRIDYPALFSSGLRSPNNHHDNDPPTPPPPTPHHPRLRATKCPRQRQLPTPLLRPILHPPPTSQPSLHGKRNHSSRMGLFLPIRLSHHVEDDGCRGLRCGVYGCDAECAGERLV